MINQNLINERALLAQEYSSDAPCQQSRLHVIDGQQSWEYTDLRHHFRENKDAIKGKLETHGALLFRNFPIADAYAAEELILNLGIKMDNQYLGGLSPRKLLTNYTFSSTGAPAPYIISFHTEMCYLKERPHIIIFHCINQPQKYGETSLFDCEQTFSLLAPSIQKKLCKYGICYRRYNKSSKSFLNVNKSWKEAYHSNSVEEAEKICTLLGLDYRWTSKGDLITEICLPGVITHHKSHKTCISMTIFNEWSASCDLKQFSHRFNPLYRRFLSWFIEYQWGKKDTFMKTLWGNGEPLTKHETFSIIKTSWQCSTIFRWQRGDLLILNNILWGHGRMNVKQPRKIAAALGDLYRLDQNSYYNPGESMPHLI